MNFNKRAREVMGNQAASPPMRVVGREHEAGALAGKARWWTLEGGDPPKQMELVRLDFSDVDASLLPFYVFLPPSAYAHPPLVGGAFRMSYAMAAKQVKELGGTVLHYESRRGKALELWLLGFKR